MGCTQSTERKAEPAPATQSDPAPTIQAEPAVVAKAEDGPVEVAEAAEPKLAEQLVDETEDPAVPPSEPDTVATPEKPEKAARRKKEKASAAPVPALPLKTNARHTTPRREQGKNRAKTPSRAKTPTRSNKSTPSKENAAKPALKSAQPPKSPKKGLAVANANAAEPVTAVDKKVCFDHVQPPLDLAAVRKTKARKAAGRHAGNVNEDLFLASIAAFERQLTHRGTLETHLNSR